MNDRPRLPALTRLETLCYKPPLDAGARPVGARRDTPPAVRYLPSGDVLERSSSDLLGVLERHAQNRGAALFVVRRAL
jgi:hypothetical protein